MQKLYLYLASRSKRGIKLITVLKGDSRVTSRLTDLSELKLPQVWQNQINRLILDHKMLYEPWIESAKNYNELRERLQTRGYSEIPSGAIPLLNLGGYEKAPKADTSNCEVKTTMLRKKKD